MKMFKKMFKKLLMKVFKKQSHSQNRDPNFTYNLEMIKKFAVKELSTYHSIVSWYDLYFDFENYRVTAQSLSQGETDDYPILSVDNFDQVLLDTSIDSKNIRHTIRLSDLTDEERKDLFDTIKTACDAVSL